MSLPPSSPMPIQRTSLFIGKTEDAFVVLQAALDGNHHLCTRSLSDREREQLQYHGSVVVWDETAVANDPANKCKGKQRWKYSTPWTPSRMQGVFLLYRQILPKKGPRSEHAPPLPQRPKQELDEVFGAHKGNKEYPINGLMRKTLSVMVDKRELHLINYYDPYKQLEEATRLPCPSAVPPYSRYTYNIHPHIIEHPHRVLSSTFTVDIRGAEKPKLIYAGDDRTSQKDLKARQEGLESFLTTTLALKHGEFSIVYNPAPKRQHASLKHARDESNDDTPEEIDHWRKKRRLNSSKVLEEAQQVQDEPFFDSFSSVADDTSDFRPSSGIPSRGTSQPPYVPSGLATAVPSAPTRGLVPPLKFAYPLPSQLEYPSISYPVAHTPHPRFCVDSSFHSGFKPSADHQSFGTLNGHLEAEAPPSPIENVFPSVSRPMDIPPAIPHLSVPDEYSPSTSSFTSNGYPTPPPLSIFEFGSSSYSTFNPGGLYELEAWTSSSTLLSAIEKFDSMRNGGERTSPSYSQTVPDTSMGIGMGTDPPVFFFPGGFTP